MFEFRPLSAWTRILVIYAIGCFVTLVVFMLILKYVNLFRDPAFFFAILETNGSNKEISKYLSSGEILFVRFVFELPGLIFGAVFGVLGACLSYLRATRHLIEVRHHRLHIESSIGALMGIVTYVIVQSRSIPKVLHPSINVDSISEPNVYIVALFCFVAGLFSGDLIDSAEKRVRQFAGTRTAAKKPKD